MGGGKEEPGIFSAGFSARAELSEIYISPSTTTKTRLLSMDLDLDLISYTRCGLSPFGDSLRLTFLSYIGRRFIPSPQPYPILMLRHRLLPNRSNQIRPLLALCTRAHSCVLPIFKRPSNP